MVNWHTLSQQLATATDRPFSVERVTPIGGGCINETHLIEGSGQRYFVKLNNAGSLPMFEAEAAGLQEIGNSHTLRVPTPVCWGKSEDKAWLVLEYLEMGSASRNDAAELTLGRGLAAMHGITTEKFGWHRDNTIGATPQINKTSSDWIQFWRNYRLGYQLQLARANGYTGALQTKGEQLMAGLDAFFSGPLPLASLLHGDLWSGNHAFAAGVDGNAVPVIFDPAVYYGDREADLAMTELFGGFSARFYAAYKEAWPLDAGYITRKTLYNLYHILNHLNLFGGGYLHQAEQMMDKLLAEIR